MAGEQRLQFDPHLGGQGESGDSYIRPGLGASGRGGQQRVG
ncbi:hypothetical protein [Streptosporangium sp. NPDC048865]